MSPASDSQKEAWFHFPSFPSSEAWIIAGKLGGGIWELVVAVVKIRGGSSAWYPGAVVSCAGGGQREILARDVMASSSSASPPSSSLTGISTVSETASMSMSISQSMASMTPSPSTSTSSSISRTNVATYLSSAGIVWAASPGSDDASSTGQYEDADADNNLDPLQWIIYEEGEAARQRAAQGNVTAVASFSSGTTANANATASMSVSASVVVVVMEVVSVYDLKVTPTAAVATGLVRM